MKVTATETALQLIQELKENHGDDLLFHQSGGCCDGSAPMCYPANEYQVGDEGASEMNGRDHNATHATYTALRRVRTIFLPRGSQTYET